MTVAAQGRFAQRSSHKKKDEPASTSAPSSSSSPLSMSSMRLGSVATSGSTASHCFTSNLGNLWIALLSRFTCHHHIA